MSFPSIDDREFRAPRINHVAIGLEELIQDEANATPPLSSRPSPPSTKLWNPEVIKSGG